MSISSNSSTQPAEKKPGFFINRNFAFLFVGGAISNIGDFIFNTTLVIWIAVVIGKNQPWTPLAVGGCLAMAFVPTLLIGPLAGVFVDRWNKRSTMLKMDAIRTIIIALLLLGANIVPLPFVPGGRLTPLAQLVAIYIVVFVQSTCSQFFNPARFALIGDIVAEPLRARATGFMQTAVSLAAVIGPALAAPLFFAVGVPWALLANSLSFAISFCAILGVRRPQVAPEDASEQASNFMHEFVAGLRVFASNRVLMALLVTGIILIASDSALNTLDIFFVTQNLHTAPALYGNLLAAIGLGAVVGAILAGLLAQRIGVARTFWFSLLTLGVLILFYSRLTSYVPALIVLFLIGVPGSAIMVSLDPIVLHVTPREFVGRAVTVFATVISLVSMLSMVFVGYLDSTVLRSFHAVVFGIPLRPVDTIFVIAGVLCMLSGLYAMFNLQGLKIGGEEPSPQDNIEVIEEGVP
jgi:MFS family permease